MARIPDAFIDDLLARSDIVEVVGSRVPLKRQGKEYAARCPFHDERSASFTVSPTKQFYHCFGCGAHGTAISFLMNYDRLEFLDAVDELAKRVGMEVPRSENPRSAQQQDEGRELYSALDAAARLFRGQGGAGLAAAVQPFARKAHAENAADGHMSGRYRQPECGSGHHRGRRRQSDAEGAAGIQSGDAAADHLDQTATEEDRADGDGDTAGQQHP